MSVIRPAVSRRNRRGISRFRDDGCSRKRARSRCAAARLKEAGRGRFTGGRSAPRATGLFRSGDQTAQGDG
jgi:hypothetical protein